MTSTVYEGNVQGGGNLFQGQKFFIIQRVPARSKLLEDVKNNGGVIVPLEKNADVLIADHAKLTLAPRGSVSWKYIEQSVKNGQLEDLEAHRIGASSGAKSGAPYVARPVGSIQPAKTTRRPFTNEDDILLNAWVTKGELLGMRIKGNEIYKQLEAINPRHTSQSWRDRYVKYVCYHPRPEVGMDTPGPVPSQSSTTIPPITQSSPRTVAPSIPSARKSPVLPRASSHANPSLQGGGRSSTDGNNDNIEENHDIGRPFTEEDDEILEREYSDIVRIVPENLVDAWDSFAAGYGRHSAGEWYKYYYSTFLPRKKEGVVRKAKADQTLSPTSSTETKTPKRRRSQAKEITSSIPLESTSIEEPPETVVPAVKTKFLDDLEYVASITGRKIEPQFNLCGRKLELYDLWSVVNKSDLAGYKNVNECDMWVQVALRLDINTHKHVMAHRSLRELYRDNLVDLDTLYKRREGGEASEHNTPAKSTAKVTPPEVVATLTPRKVEVPSGIREIPKALSPTLSPTQESAFDDIATERIRQSLGLGELAFAKSFEEFVADVLKTPVEFEPTVFGRKISMFKVWTVALPLLDKFDEVESVEAWADVATKLGFNLSEHPGAPEALHQLCDDSLADYYGFFKEREVEKAKEQALHEQSKDQVQSSKGDVERSGGDMESPSLAFKASRHKTQKRPREQDSMSAAVEISPTSSNSYTKRSRISKGKERELEIPSTPEHILNSYVNSDAKMSWFPEATNTNPIENNITRFSPPHASDDIDSSPSRQLWSEAGMDYSHPSQIIDDGPTTQSQTDSQVANQYLEEFVENCTAKGFDENVVLQMLQVTTLDPGPVDRLLLDYSNGLGIPEDVPGVWTEDDDKGVRSHRNSEEYKRMVKKHGKQRCLDRRLFLQDLEEESGEGVAAQ